MQRSAGCSKCNPQRQQFTCPAPGSGLQPRLDGCAGGQQFHGQALGQFVKVRVVQLQLLVPGGRVDGGLVGNLPIDEARERCLADVVIVVNVGSPLMKAEDVGSLLTVSVQMVNILTEQNVNRSLARLTPSDIYIKPDLSGITAGDFQKS